MAIPTSGSVLGQVVALAIRPVRKAPPCPVESVEAISGKGLANDSHADALSPRQILIASSRAYGDLDLAVHSLRENLLVDLDTSSLVSGTVLQIGEHVRLWLTFQCEACGHLNVHSKSLSRDIGDRRGILARVLEGGVIRAGDHVRVLGQFLPEWSDDWRLRIARVLNAVPQNAVIEYRQLARLAGVPSSYCRVFPRFIKTLGPAAVRKAVPGTAKSNKPRWQGEDFFDIQLSEEPASEHMTIINHTILG
jgi:MOSC domain-containing protein YiiM